MTRASSHATLIFELSALANQYFFPAFAYSSYSMTLALASHPEVDGWDVDVIAEDHHMFCKCYFAALWELAHARKEAEKKALEKGIKQTTEIVIAPQVKIEPIFLPAVSYLVESDGYFSSLWARFEQARRHSQGVVELGYVLLQYARLARNDGWNAIPWRTHMAIMSIAVKIHTLHITSTAQCFSLIMAAVTTIVPGVFRWITTGGISTLAAVLLEGNVESIKTHVFNSWDTLNYAQQALAASLGQVSGVTLLYSVTCFVVVKDLIEGEYYKVLGRPNIVGAMPRVGEADETAEAASEETEGASAGALDSSTLGNQMPSFCQGPFSWPKRIGLLLHILSDTIFVGYSAITFYAMIPVCLAAWSLFRRGTDFEYIVAAKPEYQ